MAPDDPDAMLRAAARARGFRVVKSRRRKRGGDHGKYGLTDAAGKQLIGFGEDGLTASFEEIEDYLRRGEASAWASSLKGAKGPPRRRATRDGGATPPKRARAEPAKAPPRIERAASSERAETPLKIRRASKADARGLAALLHDAFPKLSADVLARRLAARNGSALVAVRDEIVGVLAWSAVSMLHRGDVARIALVYVEERQRRKGIGAALLKAAEERLTDCDAIEAVSDIEIRNSHRFFGAHGYAKTSYRFIKDLRR